MIAKTLAFLALIAGASAFAPATSSTKPAFALAMHRPPTESYGDLGYSYGGEEHTRDPEPVEEDDVRKSIPKAQSFEEYMKQRAAGN